MDTIGDNNYKIDEYRPVPQLGAYYAVIDGLLMVVPMLTDGSMDNSEPSVVDSVSWEDSSRVSEYLNAVFWDNHRKENNYHFKYDGRTEQLIYGVYNDTAPAVADDEELYLDPFNGANKQDYPFLCRMYDGGDTGYTRGVFDVYEDRFCDAFEDDTLTLEERIELIREYVLLFNTVGGNGYIEVRE